MAIFIYYVLVLLLTINPYSKRIRVSSVVYMLLLFCLSSNNSDRQSYEFMYQSLDQRMGSMEFLWSSVLLLMSKLNLDIQALYILVGSIYLFTINYVVPKLSNDNNRALACYMIALFFLDVVQLRYSLSCVFLMWAFYYLFYFEDRKSIVGFVLFVILSSLVHASNIVFLFMLFVKFFNSKQLVFIVGIIWILIITSLFILADYVGLIFSVESKIERIANTTMKMSSHSTEIISLFCVLIFAMVYLARKNVLEPNHNEIRIMDSVLKVSIMSLVFIPLLSLASDFRRQIFFTFFMAETILYSMDESYNNRFVVKFPYFISILYFIYSTFSANRDGVFYALFSDNLLFNCIE